MALAVAGFNKGQRSESRTVVRSRGAVISPFCTFSVRDGKPGGGGSSPIFVFRRPNGSAFTLSQFFGILLGALTFSDAHRDGKRFVVRADEKLTAFLELEMGLSGRAAM
jgi:hypothetical protein